MIQCLFGVKDQWQNAGWLGGGQFPRLAFRLVLGGFLSYLIHSPFHISYILDWLSSYIPLSVLYV